MAESIWQSYSKCNLNVGIFRFPNGHARDSFFSKAFLECRISPITMLQAALRLEKGPFEMRIAIENILPDPERPEYDRTHRAWARRRRQRRMPVVLAEQGKFYLLCGHNAIDAAHRAGEDIVECVVRQGVSDEEREEFRLADEYFSSLLPPIKMAESFINYREKYHVTQQELARRTGITAGTVHHYESLRKTLSPKLQENVDRGELTFKEARCIADIDGHQRQEELAQPFIDSRLSSVHVEELVSKAKANPTMDPSALIAEYVVAEPVAEDRVVASVTNGATENGHSLIHVERLNGRYENDLEGMQKDAFLLAGSLEKLASAEIPEYRRLRLVSTLRILSSRLNIALDHLNRYKTNGSSNGSNGSRSRFAHAVKVR